ncbi:MAG: serine/threonine protein kinase [Micromonosporaceae bacterium]|nr:serine/threonine protein kinase [Micromonosporaceae bacterium]
MSVVWRGYDTVLGRPVAVKLLRADIPPVGGCSEIVRTEARAAARMAHPNVARVYDLGQARLRSGAQVAYLVMELLEGQTLATHLAAGPLGWPTTARVCADVAAGLSASHARGIVHRDVKPTNIMITSFGAKVFDFGLAVIVGQPEALTRGCVVGTPAYVAPERLRGRAAVPASDVYGLGLVMYRCLAGRPPWAISTIDELVTAHLTADPAPLPLAEGVPGEIKELCLRCLRKNPEQRPTARQVAVTLARCAGVPAVFALNGMTCRRYGLARAGRGLARR